jgi:hypothetical protein
MLAALLFVMLAQDGKLLASHDGICRVTVPSGWDVSAKGGLGSSPDKKSSVAVGSPQRMSSFDTLKQKARKLYTKDKVTKDAAAEFEMEGQSMSGKPNVYRGISVLGSKYCTVEVIYQSGTAADARKIAESLKPGK